MGLPSFLPSSQCQLNTVLLLPTVQYSTVLCCIMYQPQTGRNNLSKAEKSKQIDTIKIAFDLPSRRRQGSWSNWPTGSTPGRRIGPSMARHNLFPSFILPLSAHHPCKSSRSTVLFCMICAICNMHLSESRSCSNSTGTGGQTLADYGYLLPNGKICVWAEQGHSPMVQ
jgi:hypothetical protein